MTDEKLKKVIEIQRFMKAADDVVPEDISNRIIKTANLSILAEDGEFWNDFVTLIDKYRTKYTEEFEKA